MSQNTHFVGLDIHKSSISIAVAEEGRDDRLPTNSVI